MQLKLMRHAQVSTTTKYGNAYMSEKRKANGAVVQMVLPSQREETRQPFLEPKINLNLFRLLWLRGGLRVADPEHT